MKTFIFWINWLKVASVVTIVFGLFMAATAIFQANEPSPIDNAVNVAFFNNSSELTPAVRNFQSWQYGVGASMLVVLGVFFFAITKEGIARKQMWTINIFFIALGTWFAIDETISVFYHVTFNAVFNIVFLLMFLVPLFFVRRTMNTISNNQIT